MPCWLVGWLVVVVPSGGSGGGRGGGVEDDIGHWLYSTCVSWASLVQGEREFSVLVTSRL